MIRPYDAWYVGGVLCGFGLRGDSQNVSKPWRSLCQYLSGLATSDLLTAAWNGFLWSRADRDAIVKALANVDPSGPSPDATDLDRFATVADIRRLMAETRWLWEGWIPSARLFGIAGLEGAGKTRTAMDLHARVYRGGDWPDGQPATHPPGRPAIWLCSDAHQDELAEMLPAFGLPDDAVYFAAPPSEPYTGTDLDDPELTAEGGVLERVIATVKPWCVFVDTPTYATGRDLCDQRVMKGLKHPLVRLAQTYGVNFGLLLHLSREGQALGRRIKGLTRTLMHLECPDPDNQPERLRFWVEKSYAKKPPALGVTLGGDGNTYDFDPPRKADPSKPPGRPSAKRDKARQFIRDALNREDGQKATSLCREWEAGGENHSTFWSARDAMVAAGEITCEGTPLVMRLKAPSSNGFHQDGHPF